METPVYSFCVTVSVNVNAADASVIETPVCSYHWVFVQLLMKTPVHVYLVTKYKLQYFLQILYESRFGLVVRR